MFECSPFFLQVAGGDDPSHCGRGVSEPSNQMLHRIVSGRVCMCVGGGWTCGERRDEERAG